MNIDLLVLAMMLENVDIIITFGGDIYIYRIKSCPRINSPTE